MRYLVLAALSTAALCQTPESREASINYGERIAAIGVKLAKLPSPATAAVGGVKGPNPNDNGAPVLLQQVFQRPVQWTLAPAVCSLLQTELSGSGQGRTTITVVKNPAGGFNYKINDEVSGSATDRNNRRYIFLYVQNLFIDGGVGLPRPQPPYDVYGTDVFQLIPADGGPAYTTNILIKVRINADGSFTDQGVVFGPNAFCDPI
jgi:hypothetical protein